MRVTPKRCPLFIRFHQRGGSLRWIRPAFSWKFGNARPGLTMNPQVRWHGFRQAPGSAARWRSVAPSGALCSCSSPSLSGRPFPSALAMGVPLGWYRWDVAQRIVDVLALRPCFDLGSGSFRAPYDALRLGSVWLAASWA